jgi:selenium metabolism protein YedF
MSDLTVPDAAVHSGQIVLAISSDRMGQGDDDLGRLLLRNHLHVLTEAPRRPDVLVFYNSGVRLAIEGSQALDDLRTLAARGTTILLCGTCLAHFECKDRVAVGEISNMYTITEAMLGADKVINL